MDAQGREAVERFANIVEPSYEVSIDTDNVLGEAFGFKAVPNGVFVGSDGRVDAIKAGKFDIRRQDARDLVDMWLAGAEMSFVNVPTDAERSTEARALFLAAGAAIRRGDRAEAVGLLELALPLEPDNLIIRKQLWAIEHPERFYDGDIDGEWQREQMRMGL